MEVEDAMEDCYKDNISATSELSKADYVCWTKLVNKSGHDVDVPVVILETKHLQSIDNKCIAQVLGYYIKARGNCSPTRQGVAMLINKYKKTLM